MKTKRPIKPKLTFTLNQYQLAHCLEIIQALEPSYHPVSLNQMVKLVVQDYIAKMSIVRNPVPSERALATIKQMLGGNNAETEISSDKQELLRIMASKQVTNHNETQPKLELDQDMEKLINNGFGERINEQIAKAVDKSKSKRSVVTDFSPPTDEDLANAED